ncbi:hypothetical protein O0I10_007840 [Lichtheimia ornata]|uniref:Uncharacterized protein n=1 Tax=Lichtheimia ornata TaxID=688661 RepID=A0AAD7UZT0_9FUNG|nr:uncharacterized protein O0I10_007840 [Lichtheimia ornata]KAJ8656517.1 hypothetical protein O0I10_007840 [Lichtheimia ornata]
MSITPLEERVKSTWNVVSKLVAQRDMDSAQDYLHDLKDARFWRARKEILRCFDNVLNIIENRKDVLRGHGSEYDFLFKIWSPCSNHYLPEQSSV